MFLFEELDENCLAFSNNEKVSDVVEIDKEAVVQDYNSQRTLDLLRNAKLDSEVKIYQFGIAVPEAAESQFLLLIFLKM